MKQSPSYVTLNGTNGSDNDVDSVNELAACDNGMNKVADTPVLSWSNIKVHSVKPYDQLRKVFHERMSKEPITFSGASETSSRILKGVSGQISGGFWAILGESGSGKTTLLNVLSRRLDILRMISSGESRINGRYYSQHDLKSFAGYVMQDDVLNAHYTVYETLHYLTALRLSGELTHNEQAQRISEVMELMDISHCRDVFVGDSRVKGISGGERKRLSVAIELLGKPQLLFLDEPTSGLDSTSALKLVKILRTLADRNECTVITTIHQPPSKVFALIDNLLLLRNGEMVYQGSSSNAIRFFEEQGYVFSDDENPADCLVQIISFGTHDKTTGQEIAATFKLQAQEEVYLLLGEEQAPIQHHKQTPWLWQLAYLVQRNFLEQFRRKERFFLSLIAALIMGTFMGMGVWHDIGHYQNSIALSRPSLFFVAVYQGIAGSFLGSVTFPADRAIMLRERQAGTYHVSAYYLSKHIVTTLGELPQLIIYCLLTYYLIGYQPIASKFVIYATFLTLGNIAAMTVTSFISIICVSKELACVIIAFTLELTRMYGGFFVSPIQLQDLNKGWYFFSDVNYVKYIYFGIALNEYTGLDLTCRTSELNAGLCPVTHGEQILHQYGYDQFTIKFCMGMLVCIILVYMFLSYLSLKFIKI